MMLAHSDHRLTMLVVPDMMAERVQGQYLLGLGANDNAQPLPQGQDCELS